MGRGVERGTERNKKGGFHNPSSFVKSWFCGASVTSHSRSKLSLACSWSEASAAPIALAAISISHKLPYIRSDTGYAPRSAVTCATSRFFRRSLYS